MQIKNEDVIFLESIKCKLNEQEQKKINKIIERYNKYLKKHYETASRSRKESKYLSEMNKIYSLLSYYRKTRNFEKINELNKLQEELKLTHERGEI